MCHENEMGAAKEQHPYIICRLDKQRRWNSGGTVTRPLFRPASLRTCSAVPLGKHGYRKRRHSRCDGSGLLKLALAGGFGLYHPLPFFYF